MDSNVHRKIDNLPAENILNILNTFAGVMKSTDGKLVTEWSPGMGPALAGLFPGEALPGAPGDERELARLALHLLADHPDHGKNIALMVENPAPVRMLSVKTAVVITLVLLALQTHISIEAETGGIYKVFIEKQPTSLEILKPLVSGLLNNPDLFKK